MDDNAPATKSDIIRLEQKLDQKIDMLRAEPHHMYDDLKEALRDSETRVLQAFYSVLGVSQKRMTEMERDTAGIKERLALMESRPTEVEKRLNLPPAA